MAWQWGLSPVDSVSTVAYSPWKDLVKNYRAPDSLVDLRTGADLRRRRLRAPELYGSGLGGGAYRAALVGKSRGLGRVQAPLGLYVSQRRGLVAFS